MSNSSVKLRQLLQNVVGPPAVTNRSRHWHEILRDKNARGETWVKKAREKKKTKNMGRCVVFWTCTYTRS